MISLIQNEVVVNHHWVDAASFTDMIAISQMTPGPIGINSATYVGYAVTGNAFGSAIATIAVSLPSFIIIITIAHFYVQFKKNVLFKSAMNGIKPVVLGLIGAAAILLVTKETFIDWKSWIIFGIAFALTQWGKFNPIYVIILAGLSGYLIY